MLAKYRQALATMGYRVFLGGLLVMLIHLSEDAVVHKENGSSFGAQVGSVALALLLVAVGAALYPLVWRRLQPVFVLLFGLLAFAGGWQAHVSDVFDGHAADGDFTGTLYAATGIILIALALKLAADAVRRQPAPAEPEP